ncbi:MAG: aminopeptidase P family protein [Abitibacteriaceae bacterium]|nr:aminopeptidase P family protein [Abditibacteriaceae bacterium]MBV9863893.1 aminopeptidase P family protein [Abditibacteriaceae bacterium]
MNYSARLDNLRRKLSSAKYDALVISELNNVRYLCGFTGTSGMLAITANEAYFITDFRYQSQAAEQVDPRYQTAIAEKGLWKETARLLKKLKVKRVGFEAEHTSVAALEDITKLLKPAEPISTQRIVEDLRVRKDADEIAIIQCAVDIIDDCFHYLCDMLRPGMTEIAIANEIERSIRERGASGASFTPIVVSGERGALPHGRASNKPIAPGDMVTIDMGALVDGYCSDCTRTICMGKPTREQQKIYELVWRAQTESSAALRPGLGCKEADAVARGIIDSGGYAEQFGHGLGHGVGLDIHEQPRLSKLGKGKLAPGMIVTSEPGIYIEGWGGVRIEDMIVITADGAQTLTHASKPRKIIAL